MKSTPSITNKQTNNNTDEKCFCGSTNRFSLCCQPFITQVSQPQTAEQLMRSRFSAYAIGNGQYIYDSYALSSQAEQSVAEINDWSAACVWLALKIHTTTNNPQLANKTFAPVVEFSAFYITDNTLYELRERSRFVFEHAAITKPNSATKQWYYLDGDIIKHQQLAKIKRNELCPCNRYLTAWSLTKQKKFKHCCGK